MTDTEVGHDFAAARCPTTTPTRTARARGGRSPSEWTRRRRRGGRGRHPRRPRRLYARNTENPLHPPICLLPPLRRRRHGARDPLRATARPVSQPVRAHRRPARRAGGRRVAVGRPRRDPRAPVRTDGWGARGAMKDASSTDLVVHDGEVLTSFWQCGDALPARPATRSTTLGTAPWDGRFPPEGVSAHTKLDEHTGELIFFNYGTRRRTCTSACVDPAALVHYTDVPLPGPRLPHDIAITEHFVSSTTCRCTGTRRCSSSAPRAEVPPRHAVPLRRRAPPGPAEDSAGSRPTRPTSCTGSTRTRTATSSCSTGSSSTARRAPDRRATFEETCSVPRRRPPSRPGRTAGGSTW